jgi:hypothetical protein
VVLGSRGLEGYPKVSGRGYGPPVEANEGGSAMRSQTGRFDASGLFPTFDARA